MNMMFHGETPFRELSSLGPCAFCSKVTGNKCSRCRHVFYCSRRHEDEHRVHHKMQCHPFTAPPVNSPEKVPYKKTRTTSSGSGSNAPKASIAVSGKLQIALEGQYIVAKQSIAAGSVIFNELPIFVAPNYVKHIVNEAGGQKPVKSYCLGCMMDFKGTKDDNGFGLTYTMCNMCKLPLCKSCLNKKENENHSQYECEAIVDANTKRGDVLNLQNKRPFQNEELIKDLSILRALLLQKTNPPKWESFINLRANVRFTRSLKKLTDKVEVWVRANTPISENYMNVISQKKTTLFRLEDVKRIMALFSEPSSVNPRVRVLYQLVSWIPQNCMPNAAKFTVNETNQHEISVKSVNKIDRGKTINFNYIKNYEGGLSTAAIKLFSETALICQCDSKCNIQDVNVAICCDFENCKGFLSPKVEKLDPVKTFDLEGVPQIWQCDTCKRRRKFSNSINSHVKKTVNEMSEEIEKFSKSNLAIPGGDLKEKLQKRLHECHWLRVKMNVLVLERINTQIGYGCEMLKYSQIKNKPVSQSQFNKMIEKKIQIYIGNGGKMGYLKLLSERYGFLSEISGVHLFDAFYAYFIDFIDKYKEQFIKNSKNPNFTKTSDDHKRLLVDLEEMKRTIEDAHSSLSISENQKYQSYAKIAKETLEALQKVIEESKKSPKKLESHLREFLIVYARLDSKYNSAMLEVSKKKPRNNLMLEDCSDVTLKFSHLRFGDEDDYGTDNSSLNCRIFFDDTNSSSNERTDSEDYDSDDLLYENYRRNQNFNFEERQENCCIQ